MFVPKTVSGPPNPGTQKFGFLVNNYFVQSGYRNKHGPIRYKALKRVRKTGEDHGKLRKT